MANMLDSFTGMSTVMKILLQKQGNEVVITDDEIRDLQQLGPDIRIEGIYEPAKGFVLKLVREDPDGNTQPLGH